MQVQHFVQCLTVIQQMIVACLIILIMRRQYYEQASNQVDSQNFQGSSRKCNASFPLAGNQQTVRKLQHAQENRVANEPQFQAFLDSSKNEKWELTFFISSLLSLWTCREKPHVGIYLPACRIALLLLWKPVVCVSLESCLRCFYKPLFLGRKGNYSQQNKVILTKVGNGSKIPDL